MGWAGRYPEWVDWRDEATLATKGQSSVRQTRDAEATKAEILAAAEEEFARFGFAGAKTDAIAARTGVTKAMIYYYFGSKDELYKAVLERPAADFANAFADLDLEHLPPEEALKTVIRVAIAHEMSHPYYGRILLHEAMENQGKYFHLTGWDNPINRVVALVERGIEDGRFRPVDPWLVVNHTMGICTFYFNAQPNMRNVRPEFEWFTPEAIERFTESAIALVLAGIKADA
ncbi:TetR/AcrR family transcriptional regulator [Nodosilinea sp. LEGE 07298]|nr:TetR/AcrR family transcriptional regulator [Nodosilinea sp. LEGE 07298]